LRTLEALKVKPEESVMIGDTYETDILGAKNLGMKAIYIQRDPCNELKYFYNTARRSGNIRYVSGGYFGKLDERLETKPTTFQAMRNQKVKRK
jgi:predicted HAD superfamily phosphohydrolase YqeG